MFYPNKWAEEVLSPDTPQKKALRYYLSRLLNGESVPEWMVEE